MPNNTMRQDRTGQDRTGQDRTGQDRTGQDRTGQDRTGQDRTGQDRTGEDRRGQDRNIGIDVYKTLCMFCVIMFHFSDHGAVALRPEWPLTLNWLALGTARIFGGICNCAFVLTTGYFLCTKPFNVKRIFKLWLEVWFYSVVSGVFCYILGVTPLTLESVITMLLPFTCNQYWFFSAYILLAILAPFINITLKNISQSQHLRLCVILFILFSLMPTFFKASWMYSNLAIFTTIYVIAAYIRFYDVKIFSKTYMYLIVAMLFIVIEIISIIALKEVYSIFPIDHNNMFYFVWPMNKVPVIIVSLALFMWFKGLTLKGSTFINVVSSSLFGVYLFHLGRLNTWLFLDIFNNTATYHSSWLVPQMIFSAITIFTVAIIFDKIRVRIFEKLIMTKFDHWKWPKRVKF